MLKWQNMIELIERGKQTGFFKATAFVLVLFVLLGNFATEFRNAFGATTLYYNAAVDTDWGTLENWWQDSGFTVQADQLPTASDDVFIEGAVESNAYGTAYAHDVTINNTNFYFITLSSEGGGVVTFNNSYNLQTDIYATDIILNGSSTNEGSLTGDIVFNDSSVNQGFGSLTGDIVFNNSSQNFTIIYGNPVFNDSSSSYYIEALSWMRAEIYGNPIFNDSAINAGPVYTDSGIARFNNATYNSGDITGDACFATTASNGGTVSGTTTVCEPLVSVFTPADDATDASVTDNLLIQFDQDVSLDLDNISSQYITIFNSLDDSTFERIETMSGLISASGDTITINPASNFVEGASYYVQVDASAIMDAYGNNFAGISDTTTWNFTTVSSPTVSTFSPADDATDVAVSINLTIVFSEAMDVETGNITIFLSSDDSTVESIDVTGGLVTGTGTDTIVVNPTADLSNGTAYYVQIDATAFDNATSVSYAGISDTTTWNFTTVSAPSGGGGGGGSPPDKACEDGLDNDGDGLVDYPDDPGCENEQDTDEYNEIIPVVVYQCADGIDNDSDGKIDYPADPGCSKLADNNETDTVYACSDGIDNDGDGLIDYPVDPGCVSLKDKSETNAVIFVTSACSDGIDNDGDGLIDYPVDLGCFSAVDNDEFGPVVDIPTYECSDIKDNDLDGLIDYPNDPECSNASDNTENYVANSGGGGGSDSGGGGGSNSGEDGGILNTISNWFSSFGFGSGSNSNSNSSCTSFICNVKNIFTKNSEISNTNNIKETQILDENSKNFTNPDFCPPGVLNAAICITQESLDYTRNVLGVTFSQAWEIIKSPEGNGLTRTISVVSLVFGAVFSILPILFTNPLSFSELALIPARLWSLLMSALGLKKKVRKWGTVYDSVTKRPLDPVYVSLQTVEGIEVTSSITDIDGRYGFLVEPGKYRIVPKKTNYSFPSLKVVGKTRDEIYMDLYFGYVFEITHKGEVISKNIPMDPLTFDWNEFAKKQKKLTNFYSKRDIWLNRIADFAFSFGFIMAILAVVSAPITYNILIFALYGILLVFREIGFRQKKSGKVVRKGTDIPLAFAIIRVFDVKNKNEVIQKVTNPVGKFFCLVSKGNYYITIESKQKDGSYKKVFTSETLKVKDGIIDGSFEV